VVNTAIFDYGAGNLLSLKIALEKTGLTTTIATTKEDLAQADAIALPGVGNFSASLEKLSPIKETLHIKATQGTPILGICLGLQLFFQTSQEGPGEGLSLFRGSVKQLCPTVKVPHMGWNTLNIKKPTELLEGIAEDTYVYFVHSLYPDPEDPNIVATQTTYGQTFTSAIAQKNIYGTQFHPEKSGEAGFQVLKNFAKIIVR
jgi:glutamine amidotransferase